MCSSGGYGVVVRVLDVCVDVEGVAFMSVLLTCVFRYGVVVSVADECLQVGCVASLSVLLTCVFRCRVWRC